MFRAIQHVINIHLPNVNRQMLTFKCHKMLLLSAHWDKLHFKQQTLIGFNKKNFFILFRKKPEKFSIKYQNEMYFKLTQGKCILY